jgi:Post-segregation antitoxin CcdA
MGVTKRKVSLTLDDDLVAELELDDETLSAQINEAVRFEVERRRRELHLRGLIARLEREDGPFDSGADEAEIARYMRLLGGPA